MTCDDLNVDFLVVVLVEECAVTCASDGAGLHGSAYTAIENVFIIGRDFGSEDRRCGLTSGYLELQAFTGHSYIRYGVKLRERGRSDGISANG